MRRFSVLVVSITLLGAGFWPVVARGAQSVQVLDARAADPVALRNVQLDGDVLSGELVNHTGQRVENVTLLVQHSFAWKNEFRPGKDDPSRAEFYTVKGEIPAGGFTRFSMQLREPLPVRRDGSFVTRAQVTRYTQVGVVTPHGPARSGVLSHSAIRNVVLGDASALPSALREARGSCSEG